jgi:uncharacterized protein
MRLPPDPIAPALPYHLLAKPAGAACNLNCGYCFFLSKDKLYQGQTSLMDERTLETYIRQLMSSSTGPEVHVAWQGGEPLLRGIEFFQRSVELARRHAKPWQRVVHSIQTNGTLVDDEWAAFFRENCYLVGLSVDGPKALHDAFRIDKQGRGSFDAVTRAWNTLRRHGVAVNILCSVHARNADHPLEVYRFLRDTLGAEYLQFIPIVERSSAESSAGAAGSPPVTDRSVAAGKFGAFLIAIFDEWLRRDVGRVFVISFEAALGSWLGLHHSCVVAPNCGASPVLMQNGDVYSCDHFVEPDRRLGNIRETTLGALLASEKQLRFGQDKSARLPRYCRECPVLFACHGECPRNRFIHTPDGEPGLNYLCAGYRAFFTHIDRPMRRMAAMVRHAPARA